MGIAKNKSRERGKFLKPKSVTQAPRFHHTTTTDPPSKNHVQAPTFCKNPAKTRKLPPKKSRLKLVSGLST
jgi:hypothetical protein